MEPSTTEVPEYRLVGPAFFEPNLLPPGSIVRFRGSPGPHLEPLNRAAWEAFEAWYKEEYDEIDPKTMEKTGRKHRPHEKYRIRPYSPAEHQAAEIVKLGGPDSAPSLSLAESMATNRLATDQRPGPSTRTQPVYQPPAEEAALEAAPEPAVEVVAVAAPDKFAARKVS